ncbi:MAG: hypothetical protein OXI60_09500 [Acidiferrobacterales bacterium]|nr:hypothetical protein [Acidiferrobacterales bacterium]
MASKIRFMSAVFVLFFNGNAQSGELNQIPAQCRGLAHTVALIDCLQNQLEILQYALTYHQTASQITELLSNQETLAPSATETNSVSDSVIDRINWFDQHLEVYAIVGSPGNLTALGRIEERHYRLQEGDSVRLAKVQKVHSRGLTLTFADHELSIGLTGRNPTPTDDSDLDDR